MSDFPTAEKLVERLRRINGQLADRNARLMMANARLRRELRRLHELLNCDSESEKPVSMDESDDKDVGC